MMSSRNPGALVVRSCQLAWATLLVTAAGGLVVAASGCTGDDCEGGCVPGTPTHDGGSAATGGNGTSTTGTGATGTGATGAGTGTGGGEGGSGGSGPPPPSYSFVVFGDNQFATTSCTSGVAERLAVPQVVLSLAPTFVMHTGDLMDHGYEAGAYAHLVDCYQGMLDEFPFFPTSGNHDMGSGAILDYKSYLEGQLDTRNPGVWLGDYASDFAVAYEDDPNSYSTDAGSPGSTSDVPSGFSFKTNYAMRFENAYVISFEQGTRWWSNTPRSWLTTHLAAARSDPTIEHLFVLMHHPLYSTHMEETSTGEAVGPVRGYYEQLFRDYDVTVAFNGHVHLYEHFHVPDDGTSTQTSSPPASYPHDGQSIHYVTTGGGGGPTPNGCSPPPTAKQQFSYDYLQRRDCGYHVTRVEVEGKRLHISVIHVTGSESDHSTELWDEFTIE